MTSTNIASHEYAHLYSWLPITMEVLRSRDHAANYNVLNMLPRGDAGTA